MSKTKEEIKKEFSDALSSNTWKSLKTGLIGKELIAYASEFLYAMQTQNDAVTNSLKASTASINDIIALGYANDVALDLYEPSFIKVKITNYTGTEVIAPFAIRLTVGTFVFTNVDYYTGSEVMTLYMGKVCMSKSYSGDDILNYRYDKTVEWSLFTQYTLYENFSQYLKMSQTVLSRSVRVLAKDITTGVVFPYTEYSFDLYSSLSNLYKVRIGRDNYTELILGDGIWGKSWDASAEQLQVFWLDSQVDKFDASSITTLSIGTEDSSVVYHVDNGNYSSNIFTVESYGKGVKYTADNVLTILQRALALNSSVSTKSQIKAFVESFSSVDDSQVIVSDNNITVYVKPANASDTNFGDIEDALMINGDICAKFSVVAAGRTVVNVYLSSSQKTTSAATYQSYITTAIQEALASDKIFFDTDISAAVIRNIASETVPGYQVYVDLALKETFTGSNLPSSLTMAPRKGTVKIYDNYGSLEAWEINGRLVGNLKNTWSTSDWSNNSILHFGDLVVFKNGTRYYSYNIKNNIGADITDAFPSSEISTELCQYETTPLSIHIYSYNSTVKFLIVQTDLTYSGSNCVDISGQSIVPYASGTISGLNSTDVENCFIYNNYVYLIVKSGIYYYLYRFYMLETLNDTIVIDSTFSISLGEVSVNNMMVDSTNGNLLFFVYNSSNVVIFKNFSSGTSSMSTIQLKESTTSKIFEYGHLEYAPTSNIYFGYSLTKGTSVSESSASNLFNSARFNLTYDASSDCVLISNIVKNVQEEQTSSYELSNAFVVNGTIWLCWKLSTSNSYVALYVIEDGTTWNNLSTPYRYEPIGYVDAALNSIRFTNTAIFASGGYIQYYSDDVSKTIVGSYLQLGDVKWV